MSIESAEAFVAKVTSDAAFAAELTQAQTAEECRALAQAAGFDFSDEELTATRAELTDEQMDEVAAGAAGQDFFRSSWGSSWLETGNSWGEPC